MPTPRSKPRLNDLRHVQRRPGFADDYRGEEATAIPTTELTLEQLRTDDQEKARRFRAEKPRPVFTAANEDVLKSSLVVAHMEMERIRRAVQEQQERGLPASHDDMRLYLKLVDAVTKLTREARAQDAAAGAQVVDLSDDELLLRAEEARALLAGDGDT